MASPSGLPDGLSTQNQLELSKPIQIKVTMMNLVNYEQDGLEIWVDESTGLAYASRKAIARLLGMDPYDRNMMRRMELTPSDMTKRIEIYTYGGTQWYAVYSASVLFDLALEFTPELAETLRLSGSNAYLLDLSGHTFKTIL